MEGKNVSPAVAVIVILIVIVIVLAVGWSIFLKKPKAPEGGGEEMSGMMGPEGTMPGEEGMPEGAMPTEGPEEGAAPETEEGTTEEAEPEGEEGAPSEEEGEEEPEEEPG